MKKDNKIYLDREFAELIAQMIHELDETYQSFLNQEPLEGLEPPPWNDENDNIHNIPDDIPW